MTNITITKEELEQLIEDAIFKATSTQFDLEYNLISESELSKRIDILPKSIDLPSNKKLVSLPLTEQIKEISKYVVLVKVK